MWLTIINYNIPLSIRNTCRDNKLEKESSFLFPGGGEEGEEEGDIESICTNFEALLSSKESHQNIVKGVGREYLYRTL